MKILCPNRKCRSSAKLLSGNVIRFGFYPTRWGKRRRYRCQTCAKTFCSNTGTPYYRLQHRRVTFDPVARLSIEGLNKSAIARVERIGWNTVDRWLEKASEAAGASMIKKSLASEPQSFRPTKSERSPKGSHSQPGSSQPLRCGPDFGPRPVVGRRSNHNALALFRDTAERANYEDILITTDGFEFDEQVIGQVFGPACIYGQVIKTRRKIRS